MSKEKACFELLLSVCQMLKDEMQVINPSANLKHIQRVIDLLCAVIYPKEKE